MSAYTDRNTTLRAIARTRLLEVRHAVDDALSTGVRWDDPELITRMAESFLDRVAEDVAAEPLRCTDCGTPVPTYRHRRWYHPGAEGTVFDILCRSCDGRREDAEDETCAFCAH